jgi:hypothetical protein
MPPPRFRVSVAELDDGRNTFPAGHDDIRYDRIKWIIAAARDARAAGGLVTRGMPFRGLNTAEGGA